jgi:WD40 repeat protein
VTGDAQGELRFWDLTTGDCVGIKKPDYDDEVTQILLSVDGSRVISFGNDGSIAGYEFEGGRVLWRNSDPELPQVTAAACSLEGSIIATVGSDNKVRVFDGYNGEVLRALPDPEVEGITSIHVVPERFEILVFCDDGKRAAWDLRTWELKTLVSSAIEPWESGEWELPEDEVSDQDVDDLADFWHRGMESADGRIAVRRNNSDGVGVYADGELTTIVFLESDDGACKLESKIYLAANGRVLWMNTRDWTIEFNKTQCPELNFYFYKSRILAWDVLSQVSGEDVETAPRESTGGEPTRTVRGDSETTEAAGPEIVVVIEEEGLKVCDHKTGECLRRFRVSGKVRLALITPDAKFLVCYSDENVQVFDLRLDQQSEEPLLVQPCLNILSGFSGARIDRDGTLVIDGCGSTDYLPTVGDILDTDVLLKLRNVP